MTYSSSKKDYLTTIFSLSTQNEELNNDEYPIIRVKDIAANLGVAPPSVVEYVQRLKIQGLLDVFPRKGVALTTLGEREAKLLNNRFKIVSCFFQNILKIESDLSNSQAHDVEHLLDQAIIRNLYDHIDSLIGCPNQKCDVGAVCIPQ